MQNLPDLEAWAIFSHVAMAGSFAKAAEKLGVSQPTVSKAIARLEKRLGTTLLYRSSRRVSLTPTGQRAMKRAESIVREGELIEAENSSSTQVPNGLLRISAPMPLGLAYIAPLMSGFLARYPDMELAVSFAGPVVDENGSGFDVTFRVTELENSSTRSHGQYRKLFAVRRRLVASQSYLAQHAPIDHPRDLEKHSCFGYSSDTTALSWCFRHSSGEEFRKTISARMRTDSAESLLPPLLAGLGIALQPELVVQDALRRAELVEVLPGWDATPIYLDVVTPPQVHAFARVAAFLDYLSENFP
ncbi:LysR family transcriptional regulator [Paraburkholderia tagetis]|uniref:LysR family transcriptional regulator n=1 Tax=Paraburkholderia tagetis TaxID=2913261 RepID=A0A9X2A3F6_9BURK|nr:LysR family transcriptional regulator [Paraburkholderia tagetis]MCG5079086.1 LysR family transcriptional regulator [Paraburkholderia tagetis]